MSRRLPLLLLALVVCAEGVSTRDRERIVLSTEVREALESGKAVVALESTIVAHGMPYPDNVRTALEVEGVVRQAGAVPATIAVLGGVVRVGLSREELETLGRGGRKVAKVSRRDLGRVVSEGADGATTVAATAFLAHRAGIRVFVTGGTGGVHRGYEETLDASADLRELGRTPVCVVSAGVKSILDVGRTLEYLETEGVAVVGYGTEEFPAFFTRRSGIRAPMRLDTPEQCAGLLKANEELGVDSGMLVAVPIPEADEANSENVEKATQEALSEAKKGGLSGRDVTPFVLKKVAEKTRGDSLRANIALVKNNARVGSAIAVAYASLAAKGPEGGRAHRVVVVGGAIVDVIAKPIDKLLPKTSNIGRVAVQIGGVGRNVAEALARIGGVDPLIITAVADDPFGQAILRNLRDLNMSTAGVRIVEATQGSDGSCVGDSTAPECGLNTEKVGTAVYAAIMDEGGEQQLAVTDSRVFESSITPDHLERFRSDISRASLVIMDGNIPEETMKKVVEIAGETSVPVMFEPTSLAKSLKAVRSGIISRLSVITPNRHEAKAMAEALNASSSDLHTPEGQCLALLNSGGVRAVVLKQGADGVVVCARSSATQHPSLRAFKPPKPKAIVNVVGAGDSLAGGLAWCLVERGLDSLFDCVPFGLRAAKMSLESSRTISPLLSAADLSRSGDGP